MYINKDMKNFINNIVTLLIKFFLQVSETKLKILGALVFFTLTLQMKYLNPLKKSFKILDYKHNRCNIFNNLTYLKKIILTNNGPPLIQRRLYEMQL